MVFLKKFKAFFFCLFCCPAVATVFWVVVKRLLGYCRLLLWVFFKKF